MACMNEFVGWLWQVDWQLEIVSIRLKLLLCRLVKAATLAP